MFEFFVIFSTDKNCLQNVVLSYIAVLRLNEIRYCSIVAKGSLEILTLTIFTWNFAFLKIKRKKYKNFQTQSVTTSPDLPYNNTDNSVFVLPRV